MVGVATVADAAIGWLVESILGYFTESLEAWILGVGLAEDEDVEELKAAVRKVHMVVAAAKGRKIENEPLKQSLVALKELLYDADDLMDELDYYRIKHQVESDNSKAGGTPDATNNTVAKSTWLPSSIRKLGSTAISTLATIVSTDSSRKRKREDDENKSKLSHRIKNIARELRVLGDDVREALGIDSSKSTGTSNLGRNHDTCPTTSYLVERKVYGRDTETEYIFKLMDSNRSTDITVLPMVSQGLAGQH